MEHEHQSLPSWIKTIVGKLSDQAFVDEFAKDPAGVLKAGDFHLDHTYHERLDKLSVQDRREMAKFFTEIAKATAAGKPEALRAIYARYADQVEDFYQWEGARDPGIRSWF